MHGEGNHANTNMHHRNKYLTTYDIKSRDTHYHLGDPTNFPPPNPFALPTNGINSTMLSRTSAGMTNNNRAAASNHVYGDTNMAGAMVQHPQMRPFPGNPSTQSYPHTGEKRDHDTALPEEPSRPSTRRKGDKNGSSLGYPPDNSYGGGSADTGVEEEFDGVESEFDGEEEESDSEEDEEDEEDKDKDGNGDAPAGE
jgi:hypothetical protein